MEDRFWVQQRFDDILLFTCSSVTPGYVYTPCMLRFVPTPLMMLSVPTPLTQHSVPTPWRLRSASIPSHRRLYRFEVPPRRRAAYAGMSSTAAAATFDDDEIILEQQNPDNLIERIGSGLSQKCISDFLLSNLGRLIKTEENIICTVCQDEIKVAEEMVTLRCSHSYHVSCIEKWLMIKNECAVCRALVISEEDVGGALY